MELLCHGPQQVFRQVHQVIEICIGLVKLKHGEFGIVPRGQPLVTEIPVNLVDPFKTTHHETLQIQFRRNTQEQVHVQRIMEGSKRPRDRPTRYRLHHRGFNLQKITCIEVLADVLNNLAAHPEGVA